MTMALFMGFSFAEGSLVDDVEGGCGAGADARSGFTVPAPAQGTLKVAAQPGQISLLDRFLRAVVDAAACEQSRLRDRSAQLRLRCGLPGARSGGGSRRGGAGRSRWSEAARWRRCPDRRRR